MPGSQLREHWRLEGYDLKGAEDDFTVSVSVIPVAGRTGGKKNVAKRNINGGSQSLQVPSTQLPVREFRFAIRRPGDGDFFAVLRDIVDYLESDDVVYVHAPSLEHSDRAYLDERLAWIVPESWEEEPPEGKGRMFLRVVATVLGIPEAYGGTARKPYHGTITKTAGGYTDDDGVESAGPYIELPEQLSGWPKAIRLSDKALIQVTTTVGSPRVEYQPSQDGGGIRNWITYDLTGFLHPAPVSTGDIGLFQLYSNPTAAWFEWLGTFSAASLAGIGSQSVGSFSVGSA